MKGKRIVAVFAHPDDETFICGGTLAKYAKEGASITLVCATRGEMGRRMGKPAYLTRESMPFERENELKKACRELGIAELIFLDLRDKTVEFVDREKVVSRIAEFIEERNPDVVLTFHPKFGGHPDHCAIGDMTIEAFGRRIGNGRLYFISFGETMKNPEPYGYGKHQIVRIDVSGVSNAKLRAFRAHRCQTEIEEWVWGPDEQALSRFSKYEYFMVGDAKSRVNEDSLFD